MQLSLLITQGREYQTLWPNLKSLSIIFPDPAMIALSRLLQKTAPMIASLSFVAQYLLLGEAVIPRALAMSLLVISIPYQSLIWLGYRSQQPLPISLISWCNQIRTQLVNHGMSVKPLSARACYNDMAHLLNDAHRKLDQGWQLP